jgi:hypothetical protein
MRDLNKVCGIVRGYIESEENDRRFIANTIIEALSYDELNKIAEDIDQIDHGNMQQSVL